MHARGAVALLVVLSMVAVAGGAAAESVDKPAWTLGDYWTYRTNTTLTAGLNLTGTATTTVSGTVPTLDGAASVDAIRLVTLGSGTASGHVTTPNGTVAVQGSWTLTGEQRLDPASLQPLYDLLDLSVNGTYEYFIPVPFSFRFQNTTTYQILSEGWTYPMVVGTAGNVTVAFNYTQDLYSAIAGNLHTVGSGVRTTSFALAAAVSVATPAGTFSAYPLREVAPDGTWQRVYYAPSAGDDVRTEAYDRGGNLTAVGTLIAYRYQAAQQTGFLGLPVLDWILVFAIVAVAAIITVVLVWKRRRKKSRPTPTLQPSEPTSGPRGP